MILGQVGFRYTKFIKRWTLSNDMKFFVVTSTSRKAVVLTTTTAQYAAAPAVGAIALSDNQQTATYSGRKGEASTIGFDLRVEGAYKATKYLDVRGGFAMLYFARGIWRGSTPTEGGNSARSKSEPRHASLHLRRCSEPLVSI